MRLLLATLLSVLSITLFAQKHNAPGITPEFRSGEIKGKIIDQATSQPVEYANILLLKTKDSSMVSGIITNNKGEFILDKIPAGIYYLKISFIGYKDLKTSIFKITPNEPSINLGEIKLVAGTSNLSGVNITADKKLIEYTLDKKVVNVEKNLTTGGGTAVDVLQNVPSVQVDDEGTVSLRGSSNVSILIDGRPSTLSGSSRNAILEQIPASTIESIEIITNPSAKYNPEGMTGIINIRLKKRTDTGLNGNVSLSYGVKDRYNGSLNLNYNKGKFNFFTAIDGRWFKMQGYGDMLRKAFNGDSVTYDHQHTDNRREMINKSIKGGFDYYINKKNSITFSYQLSKNDATRDGNTYNLTQRTDLLPTFYQTKLLSEPENNTEHVFTFFYKRNFNKPKQELTADISYRLNNFDEEENYTTDIDSFASGVYFPYSLFTQKTHTDGNNKQLNAQLNYVHPLNDKMKIEGGYHAIVRYVDSDFHFYDLNTNFWTLDPSKNNHFVYTENIQALYAMYSSEWKKFSFQLGGRLEQALTTAEQKTDGKEYKNDYMSFYPSVHVSYKLPKDNEMQLSYSRRVSRPDFHSLNPFRDYDDVWMVSYGNPSLKPEYTNSFELGHTKYWKKTSLYTNVYYRFMNDIIRRYSFVDVNGITNSTSMNLSTGKAYGIDFVLDHEILKWWKSNISFSYFRTVIDGSNVESGLESDNYSWTSKLNSTMNLPWGINLQFNVNYRGPIVTPQGEIKEMYFADIAAKKNILKERGSISVRLSDMFNTQKFSVTNSGTNFESEMIRKRTSMLLFITFTYKINGGIKQRPARKQNDNNERSGEDYDM